MDIARHAENTVDGIDGLNPLARDELAGEELRKIALDVVIAIGLNQAESSAAAIASRAHGFGNVMEKVAGAAAAGQKRPFKIRQPERPHDVEKHSAGAGGQIALRHKQGNIGRQAIVPPDLHDVRD